MNIRAPLGDMDPQEFLDRYWQKKPCLIRNAFPDFEAPIDGNDLAGMACEPLAESRMIHGPDDQDQWTLRHGPFDEADFDGLSDQNWTLLVQDAEKHYAPLQTLLASFGFLPSWRLDDLMISFAAPGGSVGPHVDQYDVFLLQAEGHRRWAVAEAGPWTAKPDVPIDMLENVNFEEEWTLGPGDMLYLPPGVAHHGVALDPCLTYSIGFRAPSAADLALALGEWLAEQPGEGGRFTDQALSAWPATGEVNGDARKQLADLVGKLLQSDEHMQEFLGNFLSRFRQAHEPVPGPNPPDPSAVKDHIDQGGGFVRHPWARANWSGRSKRSAKEPASDSTSPQTVTLFVSGSRYECSDTLAESICGPGEFVPTTPLLSRDLEVLTGLIHAGQILLADDDAID